MIVLAIPMRQRVYQPYPYSCYVGGSVRAQRAAKWPREAVFDPPSQQRTACQGESPGRCGSEYMKMFAQLQKLLVFRDE